MVQDYKMLPKPQRDGEVSVAMATVTWGRHALPSKVPSFHTSLSFAS